MKRIILILVLAAIAMTASAEPFAVSESDVVALEEQNGATDAYLLGRIINDLVVHRLTTPVVSKEERKAIVKIAQNERAIIIDSASVPFMGRSALLMCWEVVLLDGEHAGMKVFVPEGTVVSVLFKTVQ